MIEKIQLLLLAIPTVCYLGAGILFLISRNYPMAIVWTGYSVANCGMIWAALFWNT